MFWVMKNQLWSKRLRKRLMLIIAKWSRLTNMQEVVAGPSRWNRETGARVTCWGGREGWKRQGTCRGV